MNRQNRATCSDRGAWRRARAHQDGFLEFRIPADDGHRSAVELRRLFLMLLSHTPEFRGDERADGNVRLASSYFGWRYELTICPHDCSATHKQSKVSDFVQFHSRANGIEIRTSPTTVRASVADGSIARPPVAGGVANDVFRIYGCRQLMHGQSAQHAPRRYLWRALSLRALSLRSGNTTCRPLNVRDVSTSRVPW